MWTFLVITIAAAIFLFNELTSPHHVYVNIKQLDKEQQWFGYGSPKPDSDITISEFKVNISNETLTDLHMRLSRTRFGDSLVEDFSYGMRVDVMKNVTQYWKNTYDWRKHERTINSFPQFKTKIEGIDVHFMHVKPKNPSGNKYIISRFIHNYSYI